MTKYPPKEGFNALLDTGAIVYDITRPKGQRRWQGTNKLNPKHPTTHIFDAADVVLSGPADIWDNFLALFRMEQLAKQKDLKRAHT
jgi:hypothetical protein